MPFSARLGFIGASAPAGPPPPPGFPSWPTVPTWDELETEFQDNFRTTGDATVVFTNFGIIDDLGNNQRRHGVAHPNGNIYLLPRGNPAAVVYDPVANVATLLNTGSTNHQGGAVSGYDGKIYCGPHETSSNNSILVIDANNSTYSHITGILTTNGFQGAISLGNNILFVDAYSGTGTGANSVLYNVEANTAIVTNLNVSPDLQFTGGAYHPETGNIYFPPYNGSAIVEYDPVNDVKTNKFPISGSAQKYNSFCLGADGKLYAGPSIKKNILVYDPVANTVIESTYGLTSFTQGYLAGALGSDGNIYMCTAPYFTSGNVSQHLIICTDPNNPAYNTAVRTNFGITTSTSPNAWGMVAGDNNIILSVNEGNGTGVSANHVFKITTTGSADYNAHLSPFLNKGL